MPNEITIDEFLADTKKLTNIGEPLFLHRIKIQHHIDVINTIETMIATRPLISNHDLVLAALADLKEELKEAASKVTQIIKTNQLRRSGIAIQRAAVCTVQKGRTPKVSFTRNSVQTRLNQVGADGGFAPLVLKVLSDFRMTESKRGLTPDEMLMRIIPIAGARRGKINKDTLACLSRLTEYDLVRANDRLATGEYLYIASPLGRYVIAN